MAIIGTLPTNTYVAGSPTTSAGVISTALAARGSPLAPYAREIYDLGVRYGVDPNLFMAIVWYENWWGTHPESLARTNYNWASISNAVYGGWAVAGSRWGQYPDPRTGIEAFYKLITIEYFPRGQNTVGEIIWGVGGTPYVTGTHAYAPAFENRPDYASDVVNKMRELATTVGGMPPGGMPRIAALTGAGIAFGALVLIALLGD